MTHDEATAALAADPAALVFAGRDYDALAASFGPMRDPEAAPKIEAFRRAVAAAPDAPSRLQLTRAATAELAAILAGRENARAAAASFVADSERRFREGQREYDALQARIERAHRAFFPTFQTMRARLLSAETEIGRVATAPDMDAHLEGLAADLTGAIATMRTVGKSIMPEAA